MNNIFKNLFGSKPETVEPETPVVDEAIRQKAYSAYKSLVDVMKEKKATKADLTAAIEEAISYLGEIVAE